MVLDPHMNMYRGIFHSSSAAGAGLTVFRSVNTGSFMEIQSNIRAACRARHCDGRSLTCSYKINHIQSHVQLQLQAFLRLQRLDYPEQRDEIILIIFSLKHNTHSESTNAVSHTAAHSRFFLSVWVQTINLSLYWSWRQNRKSVLTDIFSK